MTLSARRPAAAALRPTLFCGVPRVFDRIYAGVMGKVRRGAGALSTAQAPLCTAVVVGALWCKPSSSLPVQAAEDV